MTTVHRTQRAEAGVHRRRGWRQGVPDSNARRFNYYTPAEAQADPLRGRDRRGPARPAALPQPGLARTGSPTAAAATRWTGPTLKAWGSDRPEPERVPGSGGKGYDWPALGWHEFRDPNEEWELTLYRYNAERRPAAQPEHRERPGQAKAFEQWNRELGALRRAQRRRVDARRPRPRPRTCSPTPTAARRPNMHNNAISVNSMHRIRSAQDLALYNLTLSEEIDGFDGTAHLDAWNSDPAWQGVRGGRRAAHRAIDDWCEAIFAANVVFEPLVGELFRSQPACSRRRRATATSSPRRSSAPRSTTSPSGTCARPWRCFELLTNDREFADHNKAIMQRVAVGPGCRGAIAAARTLQPIWSPARRASRRDSRTAWTGPRTGSAGILTDLGLEHPEGAGAVTTLQDGGEPVQVRQHRVQHVRLHPDEQPGRRGGGRGHGAPSPT